MCSIYVRVNCQQLGEHLPPVHRSNSEMSVKHLYVFKSSSNRALTLGGERVRLRGGDRRAPPVDLRRGGVGDLRRAFLGGLARLLRGGDTLQYETSLANHSSCRAHCNDVG